VSQPPDFETLYRANHDPWRVGTSSYEQRKLDIVLACLSRPRYSLAWDPACGTGHLAARLAERCDQVLASDASEAAVALTTTECGGLRNVTSRVLRLPAVPADLGAPDLIVLSEFFYYLADAAPGEDDRSARPDRCGRLRAARRPLAPRPIGRLARGLRCSAGDRHPVGILGLDSPGAP